MKQIIAITNQKGGVGKTTTAHALGAALRHVGQRVLYIDMDAQGSLSYAMGAENPARNNVNDYNGSHSTAGQKGGFPTVLDVLTLKAKATQAIQHTPSGDLIAYDPALSGADMTLDMVGREYRLRDAIAPILDAYEWIIIDTPPALGVLTVNALAACTWVVIPAQADVYSLQGIAQLYSTIQAVLTYCNPSLQVKGILLTEYGGRTILSRDIATLIGEAAKGIGAKLFSTTIRQNVALREAQAKRMDIFTYAPASNAAHDYTAFLDELLKD